MTALYCLPAVSYTHLDVYKRQLNRVGHILYNVKAETAQQEKYYELILDFVSTGLLVLNDNGAVYQKNKEALRLLGLNVFTHVRQLSKVDATLMEKIENCCSGDKLQVVFHNERGTVNLSIRVSEINVHKAVSYTHLVRQYPRIGARNRKGGHH